VTFSVNEDMSENGPSLNFADRAFSPHNDHSATAKKQVIPAISCVLFGGI